MDYRFVRGEGFCVLIIKSLSEAIKNNDPIRAIIKATATNQVFILFGTIIKINHF